MTETEWLTLTRFAPPLSFADEFTHLSPRKQILFACGCCRLANDRELTPTEEQAIGTSERLADADLTRRRPHKHCRALEAPGAEWFLTSTQWERSFRRAVIALFYPAPLRSVPRELLDAVRAVRSRKDSAAFETKLCDLLRDVFGNPFRPVPFSPEWRTDTAMSLARGMYDSRDFSAMPILADALQDVGCDNEDVLNHCRDVKQVHVRGCWVVDLVFGKV